MKLSTAGEGVWLLWGVVRGTELFGLVYAFLSWQRGALYPVRAGEWFWFAQGLSVLPWLITQAAPFLAYSRMDYGPIAIGVAVAGQALAFASVLPRVRNTRWRLILFFTACRSLFCCLWTFTIPPFPFVSPRVAGIDSGQEMAKATLLSCAVSVVLVVGVAALDLAERGDTRGPIGWGSCCSSRATP